MINNFYNKSFLVLRDVWKTDEDENEYTEQEEIGTVQGHLQQANQEMIERFGLNFQTSYSLWCDVNSDIKISDQLENEDYKFTVRAIQINDYGFNPHLEILLDGGLIQGS